MNLVERAVSPTPTFFQKLRNIGLLLAAISAAVVATPISLPAIIVKDCRLSRCCRNCVEWSESGYHHYRRLIIPLWI